MAATFAAGFLVVLLIVAAPFVRYVQLPAMAAIILFVAWRLINFDELRHIVTTSRSETLILTATLITGVVVALDSAVIVGVLVSLCVFLKRSASPSVNVGAPTLLNERRVFRNAYEYDLPRCPQITNMRIEGSLFFASVEHVEHEFRRYEALEKLPVTRVLGLKGLGEIDLSGADFRRISTSRGPSTAGRLFSRSTASRKGTDYGRKPLIYDSQAFLSDRFD